MYNSTKVQRVAYLLAVLAIVLLGNAYRESNTTLMIGAGGIAMLAAGLHFFPGVSYWRRKRAFEASLLVDVWGQPSVLWRAQYRFKWVAALACKARIAQFDFLGDAYGEFPIRSQVKDLRSPRGQ
jgi:hypothetical protein